MWCQDFTKKGSVTRMGGRFSLSPANCQVPAADPPLERFIPKGHTWKKRTLLTENKMLRWEYKVAHMEADVGETSDLLCRPNKGGDKMVICLRVC